MRRFTVAQLLMLVTIVALIIAFLAERRSRLEAESHYASFMVPAVRISYPLMDERWASLGGKPSVVGNFYMPIGSKPLGAPRVKVTVYDPRNKELFSGEAESYSAVPRNRFVYGFYINFPKSKSNPMTEVGTHFIRADVYDGDKLIASDVTKLDVVPLNNEKKPEESTP